LAERLSSQFGLTFVVSEGTDENGPFVDLRPLGLEPPEGFKLRVQLGWRSVEASLILDTYSGQLVRAMNQTELARRKQFCELAAKTIGLGATVRLLINNSEQPIVDSSTWPPAWQSLSLSVRRSPLDLSDVNARMQEMRTWAGALLAMIVLLLPLNEDVPTVEPDMDLAGLPEGARTRVEVNRYERNRINRAICIQVKGTRCFVCATDLAQVYGEIGRDYIHVHHLIPLASKDSNYRVDPVRDLIPICPNCHAMAHRRSPPIPPEELTRMIRGTPH
jgi:5-methylcytosine-specific restriction protein A